MHREGEKGAEPRASIAQTHALTTSQSFTQRALYVFGSSVSWKNLLAVYSEEIKQHKLTISLLSLQAKVAAHIKDVRILWMANF